MASPGMMDQFSQGQLAPPNLSSFLERRASARLPADVILSMRMQKVAAMGPHQAADYYGDILADAASRGSVRGEIHPDDLAMLREQATHDVASHVAKRQTSADYAQQHPIRSRLGAAAMGGIPLGIMGGLGGAVVGGGKGALVGGLGGLVAGGVLTQHLGSPEHTARQAATAAEAQGALNDPVMNLALKQHAANAFMEAQREHELEAAKSQGQYGQEARAKAKLYNTALKHQLQSGGSYDAYDEPYAKFGAARVADAWGRQMAQMEKSALPALGTITSALRGIGGRALSAAKANPAMLTGAAIGAGTGALGGAVAAEPGQRFSGALKGGLMGGAVGGAAGYAVPKVQTAMGKGESFGQAMKSTGKQAWGGLKDVYRGPGSKQLELPFGKPPSPPAVTPTGTTVMPQQPQQGSLF